MKKLLALLLFILLFGVSNVCSAAKIPEAELEVLKKEFPNMKVRFDALVELSDGTKYIPVYPIKTEFVTTEIKVINTIPKNQTLKDKPDFFMFNSNFAFFKIKNEKDKTTVIYSEEIPNEVKMGLLPQDLLVPKGFQLPAQLRIIAGNLVIPVRPSTEYKEVVISTGKEVVSSPRQQKPQKQQLTIQPEEKTTVATIIKKTAEQLSNKYFYATSFNQNALTILNADTGKAFKQIEFASIPSDMKLVSNGKYLLLTTIKNDILFVIDTAKTEVLKEINVGEKPYFIAISEKENLAYIANRGENTISVLDITSMQLKEPIQVTGSPCYIEISADGESLYYLDAISGIVYHVKKQNNYFEPYGAQPLFRANNISKIQLYDNKIYTLDRADSVLQIFYIDGKKQEDNIINVANTTEETTISQEEKPKKKKKVKKEEKEKLTFKQKTNKVLRKLLYYTDEPEEIEAKKININNEVQVLDNKEIATVPTAKAEKKSTPTTGREKFKTYLQNFLNYKDIPEKVTETKELQLKRMQRMDFIQAKNRANDFFVINGKIYLLCSDDYLVHIYNAYTNEYIKSFELEKIGYYNAIRTSVDRKIGIVTNISSQELTIFDTTTDEIVEKLPLQTNVHNVAITSKY